MRIIKSFKKIANEKMIQRVFVIFMTIILLVIIISSGGQPQRFDLKLKQYSEYDIFAPRDVIDIYTKEKLEREASEAVEFQYAKNPKLTADIELELDLLFKRIIEIRSNDISKDEKINQIKENISAKLTQTNIETLATIDSVEFAELNIKSKELLKQILDNGVKEETIINAQELVKQGFQKLSVSENVKLLGYNILVNLIRPNMYLDIELTREARAEAKANVKQDDYTYRKGRKIISKGDEVTLQHIGILRELGMLRENLNSKNILPKLGVLIIVLFAASMIGIYTHYFDKKIYIKVRELSLLCIVFIVTLFITASLYRVFVFVIPIAFAVMLISIFLDKGLAIVSNIALTLLISITIKTDPVFILSSLISGTFAALLVNNVSTRSRLMFYGIIISLINVSIVVGMGLLNKYSYFQIIDDSKNAFINVFLSTIFVIGTLPLWESIFNIITPFKLLELSNANQPLLRKLMIEAPGTYHHSLMVGNLAEAGAEAIGANGLLSRVAAYYHDVGKLRRPYFYKENQINENVHNNISALTSASLIISHAKDGLSYADQYKVPPQIKDIIEQHHGTTLVAYFFYAAQKENSQLQVEEKDFRYKGPRPQSREAAVVMLADSVEASVRSISEPTEEKMNLMIKKVIKDKLDDGQLDDCIITLSDIDKISKAFMNVLSGLFHQRIEYPEIANNNAQRLSEIDPLNQKILKL